jgi:hypothetical protein
MGGRPGTHRPEGPKVNSHAREGVGEVKKHVLGPKDRQFPDGGNLLPHLRRCCLIAIGVHALTGVAINFRPSGPVCCASK